MENEHCLDENFQKKGRHRKKQLFKSILRQMEFYFSDSNLSKERFLGQLLQNDPYVDVSIFLNFNKIRKLTSSIDDVTKAISKSALIELNDDKTKVRRKVPLKVKENVDECTIYVERLKSDATHEWLTSIFSEFGKVVYVSIPKYTHSNVIKGFAFVEFETEEGANAALNFFESIGCKIPSMMEPQKLYSIATFDCKNPNNVVAQKKKFDDESTEDNDKKRKLSDEPDEEEVGHETKKVKKEEENGEDVKVVDTVPCEDVLEPETISESEEEKKRKKQKKSHKKRATLKEIGLHVLSKKDWKKMRNKYLEMQRKSMTELKRHLNKHKSGETAPKPKEPTEPKAKEPTEIKSAVQEFVPGIIVKVALTDPLVESKKMKDELKTTFPDIQYIDIPHTYGSQEIFIRFKDGDSANGFCATNFKGHECAVLGGEEETKYWQRIEESRNTKLKHANKKQRGRDKLLKKAEKQSAQHIRFDD